jgi:ATP-binding cassette, subfamily C, bacterial CydCD
VRPFDPRLLRYARVTRGLLIGLSALGLVHVLLAVALAALIAEGVTSVFEDGEQLNDLRGVVIALLVVVLLRATVVLLQERLSARASAKVKATLSEQVVTHVAELGPAWLVSARRSRLIVLLASGLDALDEYFARYLPQLVYSAIIPLVVVVTVAYVDWLSALVIALTLPLIPLFMVLIGWRTQTEQDRQWNSLQTLSGHFLDVLRGLVTLKIFGRSQGQDAAIADVSERYRARTMKVLRISFVSSFTLELLATLSVAIVAVEIGLRLIEGQLSLQTGLFVLILAPEAYLPLRQVGVHFHASQSGLAAAQEVFEILEETAPPAPDRSVALVGTPIHLDARVRHPERSTESMVARFDVRPGRTLALVGPSGGGKSTALGCLMGVVTATGGGVDAGGVTDACLWRDQIAWMPQHPGYIQGSIADNVRVVAPLATDREVTEALVRAGAEFVSELPAGIDTPLGEQGLGLSVGQRQRVALARVFVRQTAVALLDEPTAGLDGATERAVVDAIKTLAGERTVVVVAHRPALAATADETVVIRPPMSVRAP